MQYIEYQLPVERVELFFYDDEPMEEQSIPSLFVS